MFIIINLFQLINFSSFEVYRQQIDDEYRMKLNEYTSSSPTINEKLERVPTQTSACVLTLPQEETSLWSTQETNDWGEQSSPMATYAASSDLSSQNIVETLTRKLDEITSEYPDLFPNRNLDTMNVLDQLFSIVRNFQNQIKDLQK